jgi:hypothetical protein
MPRFISFRDDGKDRWKIGSGGDAKKEEKNVESEVTICPLEPEQDEANTDESQDYRSLITPDRGKATRDQKDKTVTNGK